MPDTSRFGVGQGGVDTATPMWCGLGMSTHPITMWRRRANLTQAEVASRLGVTQQAVAKWERGIRVPRRDQMLRLVAASEGALDADAILQWRPDPDAPSRSENGGATP